MPSSLISDVFHKNALTSRLGYLFDVSFYDIGNLTKPERQELMHRHEPEGSVILVHPESHDRDIEIYDSAETFLSESAYASALANIAVPGVGSSDMGSASLARMVANATDKPALGIVIGLGPFDILEEAMHGYFTYGVLNNIQSVVTPFVRASAKEIMADSEVANDLASVKSAYCYWRMASPFSHNEDVAAVQTIMQSCPIETITGHSKGALVINDALYGVKDAVDVDKGITISTFGCGIRLPSTFSQASVHQFMGTNDMLGLANTPKGVMKELAWQTARNHTLNTDFIDHMPAERLLSEALAVEPAAQELDIAGNM